MPTELFQGALDRFGPDNDAFANLATPLASRLLQMYEGCHIDQTGLGHKGRFLQSMA